MLGDEDCVEAGYLLIPAWLMEMGRGDFERGTPRQCERKRWASGSANSTWPGFARDDQARALLNMGRVEEGLRLVDEAMIAATSGELSPIVTGILLLQHARVLPGRPGGRPCPGVDARVDSVV